MTTAPSGLLNVFEPDLKRGSARLDYAPDKKYFYVEHPIQGWRVYLRAAIFLHEEGKPFDSKQFLVVKRKDATASSKAWEPPKGQMEGKDGKPANLPLIQLMANNVLREAEEEAKIKNVHKLRYTGLVVQSHEPDYPENHYFQYHIFQAYVSSYEIQKAQDKLQWLREHPSSFNKLKAYEREKDDLTWFDPEQTKLMGRWSPSIVALYLQASPEL